ncbi:hypothetical protein ACFJGX_20030 [Hydrogenophaga sp. UC242_50]|uniref:hypothetical protein n=1 Tax=unclassified Hydrogenophaga TaxID=2610897 RepID=UPI0036D33BB2
MVLSWYCRLRAASAVRTELTSEDTRIGRSSTVRFANCSRASVIATESRPERASTMIGMSDQAGCARKASMTRPKPWSARTSSAISTAPAPTAISFANSAASAQDSAAMPARSRSWMVIAASFAVTILSSTRTSCDRVDTSVMQWACRVRPRLPGESERP